MPDEPVELDELPDRRVDAGHGGDSLPVHPSAAKTSAADSSMDSVPSEPPPLDARPAWFQRKQKPATEEQALPPIARRRRRKAALPRIEVRDDQPEELTASQQVLNWIRGRSAASYYISAGFHVLVLAAFLLMIVGGKNDNEPFGMTASLEEKGPGEDEFLQEAAAPAEVTIASTDQVDQLTIERLPVTELLNSADGVDPEGELEVKLPSGGNIVSKGSFSVWTMPEDPQPGQQYRIVIQVRLPESCKRYPVSDLSGEVLGSDEYTQRLPVDSRKPFYSRTMRGSRMVTVESQDTLPIRDHQVQLIVFIPGADRLVKDTIKISSKMLKEQQTLELEF